MKLKFKKQQYQTDAVNAVVECFRGQGFASGFRYDVDPGIAKAEAPLLNDQPIPPEEGFANPNIRQGLQILENIRDVQTRQNLTPSSHLIVEPHTGCGVNLDIEMETGTGKTYCYIKTMFELNRQYGWSKFIVVVPSIAIREGVRKSFQLMRDHFLEEYHKQAKVFIYNSGQLHNLQSFSTDAGINVMIINVQAFASKGKENLRIYGTPKQRNGTIEMVGLDDFQSRKPIDVIRANRPILILDEPQKMGGNAAMESLGRFDALFTLRYSATHKKVYNKIYRLDALDAFNQKLVKKIAVRGISVKGLPGTNAYLYVDGIQTYRDRSPTASVEFEIRRKFGTKREVRKLGKGDNLKDLSKVEAYDRFIVSEIDGNTNTVRFSNGVDVRVGEVLNDPDEQALRRIQIREAVKAHFEKERMLFGQGIKVLSLFFIDEVAKYRKYDESGAVKGEYAEIFEEEYAYFRSEYRSLVDQDYTNYLDRIQPESTHNGYFSIDKKTNRLINPKSAARGEDRGEATGEDAVDAYDLILKDKERLLSFDEPTRFIFSHSALREGWDNPNVFVICALKHSDNTVSRRQEVGRGMRLAVNQAGDRIDDPATVHDINVLTVVTGDSYTEFVLRLQQEISASLASRPTKADRAYFTGKVLVTADGEVKVTQAQAHEIYRYLVSNNYIDGEDHIAPAYHEAKASETLADLPEQMHPYREQVFKLINSVFDPTQIPKPEDGSAARNHRNQNFDKKEFQELWAKINQQAAYTVSFDSEQLVTNAIPWLDKYLSVEKLQFTIHRGEQQDGSTVEQIREGSGFALEETSTESMDASIHSAVKYDLIGAVAARTGLTRTTVALILAKINQVKFGLFRVNPEAFISNASLLINEQKATMTIEHLCYDPVEKRHEATIFTEAQGVSDWAKAGAKLKRHIYDYLVTESSIERRFVTELDTSTDVVVYAKLPKTFHIPTPVGDYSPDWAISFKEGAVKHVYFVAETKGSMSSLQLRKIEESKIECARRFFAKITSEEVKYEVVDSYGKLMELVNS